MGESHSLGNNILMLIQQHRPTTVEELIDLLVREFDIPRKIALERIINLENEGKLSLKPAPVETPVDLYEYVRLPEARWFWVTILLLIITSISVFFITEKNFPSIYLRYLLSSLFLLFLPGFSLIKALFPAKELDDIERITFSLGTSIAIVPVIGLILNYTPIGIRLIPLTLSILILTLVLASIGIYREHQEKMSH